MKQNIPYNRDGYNFTMQFDFCPRCSYFRNCYSMDSMKEGNMPNYINQECFDELEKVRQAIWDFIKSKTLTCAKYPWEKEVKDITDEDIERIEELCAESDDTEATYTAVSSVLGINTQSSKKVVEAIEFALISAYRICEDITGDQLYDTLTSLKENGYIEVDDIERIYQKAVSEADNK